MPPSQMKKVLAVLLLLAASLDNAACTSTVIKPGEVNQTIYVNMPPTVDVVRDVQISNDKSAKLTPMPPQVTPGGDCLLSECDENDVGCDGLPPCGPYCPPEACPRVDCSQCMQAGFQRPCCGSCCGQYQPYPYPYPYPQQPPQGRPIYPQPQPMPYPQPVPIAPQPQPIPIPITVPQPYPVPQPIPYPQIQLQPRRQPQPYPAPYYMPQQCRQTQTWPFLQCGQPSNCMWYQPGCLSQNTWQRPCYGGGTC